MLQLNYKVYGAGRPLIILHGFLGSLDNWHTLAVEFGKQGLKVFVIDQRNHGKSPHTEHHSIALMADDLKAFMQQHDIPDAIILGHSMGGKVAMQFALSYPALCSRLIVADIAPRAYKRGHDDVFDAIFRVPVAQVQSRKEAETAMLPYLGDPGTRQFILKNLERTEEGGYQWKFNLKTLYDDYAEITREIMAIHSFDKPVLFLKGANSRYIGEEDQAEIKRLFPQAAIQSISNAGHWIHADQPKAFYEAVLYFVNS